jgi:2-oxoisovalerate dehydrogenase E2 component (dihydrolipoyl transacylase)
VPCGYTPAELPKRGATITVSNIGAIGKGEFAAPLLAAGGGVAIVALGRAKWVERDGQRRYRFANSMIDS